jgi:hypothetical protein
MTVLSNIDDLEKALKAGVLACVSLPIAQENSSFEKPADGAPWAAVFVLPNAPSAATLGVGGQDAYDGIMQIDLNFPKLKGTASVAAAARQITDYFHVGRVLTHNGTRVHVAGAGNPRNNPDANGYYRRSLTITWHARIDRPV